MSKERIAFDSLDNFSPLPSKPRDNPEIAQLIGEDSGFTTRHGQNAPPVQNTFDARSLRKSKRTAQLGIAVRPETKDRFWKIAQDLELQSGEEVLEFLLSAAEKNKRHATRQ
jgi:hypothetical protein